MIETHTLAAAQAMSRDVRRPPRSHIPRVPGPPGLLARLRAAARAFAVPNPEGECC